MIYLQLKKKPKTLKELFNCLFSSMVQNQLKSVTTFRDKNCEEIECAQDKFRSINDVIEICQTYFPKKTDKKIIKELLFHTIEVNGKFYDPYLILCDAIKKPTLCFTKRWRETPSLFNTMFSNRSYEQSRYKSWINVLKVIDLDQKTFMKQYEELMPR